MGDPFMAHHNGPQTSRLLQIMFAIKIMNITSAIGLFLACQIFAKAGETNVFYINDGGHEEFSYSKNIQMAKTAQESLPAKDFPEGNWGAVQDGFQLSMRFEKKIFTNGEPIVVTLLLRNVTNSDVRLSYSHLPVGYSDGPIGFQIISAAGTGMTQHKYELDGVINGALPTLFPGTQAKFSERLDKRFDLTNGIYSVRAITTAWIGIGTPARKEVSIKSAEVKIAIQPAQ